MAVKAKITNETGDAILFGTFGITANATFRVRLQPGDSFVTPPNMLLTEGDRAFVAWDEFSENIRHLTNVTIDGERVLIGIFDGGITFATPVHGTPDGDF